ncbi:carboxymuconolactone decarboxylase family protein [Corynebacterium variabile]|uniref:carboxymuconolactone decarboxylase family protein n=1 Tax=Corynebacterium variabile TaxID=1727 RepID=UPI0028B038E7|nr:carboxymuconolactone decarboxylase family protein [Corynebacterium variabile]
MTYFDFSRTRKRTYAAAGALELAARSGLDRDQRLLVQLRASYPNNCRFCIGMHTDEALKHGHDQAWCDAVRDWEPGVDTFTGSDAIILEFTTMGTRLSDSYDAGLQERVLAEFGETVTGALISQIAAINTWNRISVLSEK